VVRQVGGRLLQCVLTACSRWPLVVCTADQIYLLSVCSYLLIMRLVVVGKHSGKAGWWKTAAVRTDGV